MRSETSRRYPGPRQDVWVALWLCALTLSVACARSAPPATAPTAPPPQASPPTPAPAPPEAAPAAPAGPAAPRLPRPPRPPAPPPLLGHVTRAELMAYEPWQPLFTPVYVPDAAAVASIRTAGRGITVLMVMATWCPDSKRELPRYFAIMDEAGIGDGVLTMVGVDRTKKDAEGLTAKWDITRVPTMVFLRDGQEVGRFVERVPAGSTLEAEIAGLLAKR